NVTDDVRSSGTARTKLLSPCDADVVSFGPARKKRAAIVPPMCSSFALAVGLLAATGVTVELGGLKSTAPTPWKEVPVANPMMRVKQFVVPGKEGDAELVVFFFGENQGGGVQANLDRWKKQFTPPEGKTIEQVSKVETLKLASTKATMLDVSGTYMFKARPM